MSLFSYVLGYTAAPPVPCNHFPERVSCSRSMGASLLAGLLLRAS